MTDTKPKHLSARRSAGEDHPVTPNSAPTAIRSTKKESKNKKLSSPKPRLHYDQVRSPNRVFWSRDEHGKRIMSRSPEPDKKRLAKYDSFGFFGPEHTGKPTIASTGIETPTIMITPPAEECADEHEKSLRVERARYLRSRLWLHKRKERETSDLKVVERRYLELPPLQSGESARVANEKDNEERERRRVRHILRKDTIEALEKRGGTSGPVE